MDEASLPVLRTGPDRVEVRLADAERRILGSLIAEMRVELDDPVAASPDGALARLYPRAFPDDDEADASYADLVHADLTDGRRERLAVMEATLDDAVIDDAAAAAWLSTLNDLRLVLGSTLGVTEDDDGAMPDPDDPDAVRKAVFAWLGFLVAVLVEAQEPTLPHVPDEAA